MVLVDSNVPMYLIGAEHPHKHDARRLLEQAVADQRRLVTDTEVLHEVLHRYRAIERPEAIQPAFDVLLAVVSEVLPVEAADVQAAKDLLMARWHLSARDALHVAVMQRHGIDEIVSFDKGFDAVPGISRYGGG
jgi:predicted nucleic acid-binding protein